MAFRSARRILALSGQNSEVIAVEWARGILGGGITILCTNKVTGVLADRVVFFRLCPSLFLCPNEGVAGLNRCSFILSDSAEQHFVHTELGIEVPGTVALDEREGEGPVFGA